MDSIGVCIFVVFLLTAQHTIATKYCERTGKEVKARGKHMAPDCRYPYLVSIKDVFKRHVCSGTLIHRKYVLTAANCVANGDGLVAFINSIYKDGPFAENIPIVRVVQHPHAKAGLDVALAELKRPARQRPIQLAQRTVSRGTPVTVVGWGRISAQGGFSEIMQHGNYRISPPDCRKISVPKGFLCVGKDRINICEGDHGGPLIRRIDEKDYHSDVQIGVTSKAVGDCSRKGKPGLFINIASIRNWIDQNT